MAGDRVSPEAARRNTEPVCGETHPHTALSLAAASSVTLDCSTPVHSRTRQNKGEQARSLSLWQEIPSRCCLGAAAAHGRRAEPDAFFLHIMLTHEAQPPSFGTSCGPSVGLRSLPATPMAFTTRPTSRNEIRAGAQQCFRYCILRMQGRGKSQSRTLRQTAKPPARVHLCDFPLLRIPLPRSLIRVTAWGICNPLAAFAASPLAPQPPRVAAVRSGTSTSSSPIT